MHQPLTLDIFFANFSEVQVTYLDRALEEKKRKEEWRQKTEVETANEDEGKATANE